MSMPGLSEKQNQLYEIIDNLLWEEWDPIGINDEAPGDEYQSYTPRVFSLAIRGASCNEIAQKLFQIETDLIGLQGSFQKCEEIAEKIIEAAKKLVLA